MFILFGYPSCGKTFLGKLLADKVGGLFVDTDLEIEKRWGMSCREMVKQKGESFFRDCESEVIKSLQKKQACVVAVGGGAILREINQKELKRWGTMVYLEVSKEELKRRLMERGLPGVETSFETMYEERKPLYEACADWTVQIANKENRELILELTEIWRECGIH